MKKTTKKSNTKVTKLETEKKVRVPYKPDPFTALLNSFLIDQVKKIRSK